MVDEENVIEIKNLTKEYKMFKRKKDRLFETILPGYQKHSTFKALDDLNLTVKKGEILGILGKNGAGKSTLLKIITGVVAQTSGELNVNGKISSLLELGTAFNPELTGIENIYQHGQVMGLTNEQIESKKQEIIDFADIGEHLFQPVKTYSSGMFARLAFACAINVEPDILIVDEVLSVGDMSFQLKCFKKFEEFKKKGKTILFVTHNISDVQKNCNRTIILVKGKKIFDGDVKGGVERYKKLITGNLKFGKSEDVEEKDAEEVKNVSENKIEKNPKSNNSKTKTWKENFNENQEIIEYGNGKAEVIDYGIFNLNGEFERTISNDKVVVLKSKIRFNEDVEDPIFTMTLKDFNGNEICGTNTVIEKVYTGKYKKGDVVIAKFKQRFNITPDKYTISFSCTRYTPNGDLEVLNRKYDALLVEVLSTKEVVGMVRLDSEIEVEKVEE